MEIGVSIIIGVFTGVLSAMIIGATNIIYKNMILPWFQVKVYKGVLLEGCWNGFMQIGAVKWGMGRADKIGRAHV